MKKEKGKVISIYSPKGGVGKTVLSANIAGCSFIMGKKTLLLDADVYNGGLSLFVNSSIDKTIYTLVKDIKYGKYESLRDYVYNYNENLDILCSTKIQLEASLIKEKYLEKIINDAKNIYDYIIIDTNSIYSDFNERIFTLSDRILLILTNDIINIKNMRNIITIFKDIGINKYKILFNSSYDFKDQYFDYMEMIEMIGANIDYTIGKEGFIKNITKYLYNNCIPILYKNNDINYYKLFDKINLIIDGMEK